MDMYHFPLRTAPPLAAWPRNPQLEPPPHVRYATCCPGAATPRKAASGVRPPSAEGPLGFRAPPPLAGCPSASPAQRVQPRSGPPSTLGIPAPGRAVCRRSPRPGGSSLRPLPTKGGSLTRRSRSCRNSLSIVRSSIVRSPTMVFRRLISPSRSSPGRFFFASCLDAREPVPPRTQLVRSDAPLP